ncbi:glycosyltransferase family 4 protein [Vallicoccus soli]|nr:glycosyltransferase family 4 protein [Vallicoccus soli]
MPVPLAAEHGGGVRGGGTATALREGAHLFREALHLLTSAWVRSTDVLDANTTRAALVLAPVALATRKPLVVHLRDMVDPQDLGRVNFELLTRTALPRAAAVVANSRATLASAEPFLGPHCVRTVVPSPLGEVPAPAPVRDGVRRVGVVGRLAAWKGQDVFLRAFAEVFRGRPVEAVVVGGPLFGEEAFEDRLRDLAHELVIGEQVRFTGHVADVGQVLRSLDVAVHCSRRPEPLGQTVLQYLAAGLPTVVADAGGPAEYVVDGENGLLHPPGDAAALAQCLRRLADEPALRRRLADAAPRTRGLASVEQIVNDHHRLYQSLVGHRGAVTGEDRR